MWSSLLRAGRYLGLGLVEMLYPQTCTLCGEMPLEAEHWPHPLCPLCCAQLTQHTAPTCPRCAAPVGIYSLLEGGCSRCRGQALGFDQAQALGPYDGLLRSVVLALKYRANEMLADQVGALWARHCHALLQTLGGELIVPIPLHWWRRLRRGYNQSEALARQLAMALNLPLRNECLRRIRNTPHQTGLPHTRRTENVRGAFQARHQATFQGRVILLVDDVLTTGATAGEAARTLKQAGAKRVIAVALARTPP